MTNNTYEMYDEHEYFIRFKSLHPYVFYSKDKYVMKKKEFQIKLLDNLLAKKITDEEFKNIYKLVIIKENDKYIHLEQIKSEQKKRITSESDEIDGEIVNYMEFII